MQADLEKLRSAFSELSEELKGKDVAFCTHKQADIDALASAAVLAKHFNAKVAVPDRMNSSAQALADRFGIDPVLLRDAPEHIVAVDTSSSALLPVSGKVIVGVIDHHQRGPDTFSGKVNIIDSEARATAELVALLLPELSEEDATLLSAAIISDTSRFITATARTLDVFISLYRKSGLSYEELLLLAFPNPPVDEKVAVLEGLKGLSYEVYNDVLISTTEVSMKNGNAAHILAQAGDIGFAAQWDDKEEVTRVSSRASPHVDVPLNKVMAEVATAFNGKGGGHMKAAGCIAYTTPSKVLEKCVEVVKKYL